MSLSHQHFVRLFDSDELRVGALAAFIIKGMDEGATVLVVATAPTWAATSEALRQRHADVSRFTADGRLVVLDAHTALDGFMEREWPNPARLQSVLGLLIAELAAQPAPLRIYGEMVDVLAERGLYRAACRLEALWNELAARYNFELFCGYASGNFGNERTMAFLKAICDQHSHVVTDDRDLLSAFLIKQAQRA